MTKLSWLVLAGITIACCAHAYAYDRCHYETRVDGSGKTYNVLVCCDETGRCRESRVR